MRLYLEDLPKCFREMGRNFGDFAVTHTMVPFRPIDVTIVDGTQKWSLIDLVEARNKISGEMIQFRMAVVDIPYKSTQGFLVRGVNRQFVDRYEMSKGWHFDEGSDRGKGKKIDDPLSLRQVKFLPDTALAQNANFYEIKVHGGIIQVAKKDKMVPLSIFLRALTGISYQRLMEQLGATNKYVIATFSLPEPSRVTCVDIANVLFATSGDRPKDVMDYREKRAGEVQDTSKIVSFVNKFIGEGAMIGNGAERVTELFSFRSLKNCFLARPLVLGGRTLEEGTQLAPELLAEIDYSPVDILYCKMPESNKVYIFKKYEIYNFRGLNCGATDTLDDLRAAEDRGYTEYMLSTGVTVRREPAPVFNTVGVIMNIVNVYINFLNGFNVNSNVYDMSNQSVVPIEQEIFKIVTERLTLINQKVRELADESDGIFSVRNLPSKLVSFDQATLIDKYSHMKGKTAPLANIENSLGPISQRLTVVKDVKHSQGAMVSVQDTQIGKLDPFDAPENKNVGLTHNRTFLSRVRPDSQIECAYVRVADGQVQPGIVYLSATGEKDQYIGQWDEDFSKEHTMARFNGLMMMVEPGKLNYLEASCFQHFSAARAISPFPECMAGKRATMSSSQAKQAIAILGAERPLVNSGAESLIGIIGAESDKPFITANELLREFCLTNGHDFDSFEDVVVRYDGFVDHITERIHNLSFVANDSSHKMAKHLPYCHPSLQKTVFGYMLNQELGIEFKGEDIVFHAITYDPKKYKRNDSIKEGALSFPSETYDTGMALGLNLTVAYMTYEGVTIDDAIVINSRLVTEDKLTSVFLHQEEYEIDKLDEQEEIFGYLDGGPPPKGFMSNGLPLVGTYLEPGSTIIYKYVTRIIDGSQQDFGNKTHTTNIDLPPTVGGQVVASSVVDGSRATVMIVSLAKMEVGDKMAGRYGNKGVVAKIVPHSMMPYDPATGKTMDIILNPLGIPSRINVSQVLEATFAAVNKQQGTIAVVTPFQPGFIDKIKADAKAAGIKPIRLMNPKTGLRTEYPVHVGEIYMYKLVHRVAGKLRSIGVTREVDQIFKQPIGTGKGKEKGQAFGELESWCGMSAECFHLLEELQTILSEDSANRDIAIKQIEDKPGPVDMDASGWINSNGKHLNMFFQGSAIKLVQDSNGAATMQFRPMSDKDIMGLNPANPVTINDIRNSLRSESIFKGSKYAKEDMWSWMPLGGKILSPYWIERGKIYKCITVTALQPNNRFKEKVIQPIDINRIMAGKAWLEMSDSVGADESSSKTRWIIHDIDKRSSEKEQKAIAAGYISKGYRSGMPALVELFENYDLTGAESFYMAKIEKDNTDIEAMRILSTIRDLQLNGGLAQYVISTFPVLPIRYRPTPIHASKQQDFDYFYTAIARCVQSYQASRNMEDQLKIYEYIQAFLGVLPSDRKKAILADGDDFVDLKKYATDKQSSGRFREMMAKKCVHRSGRSVLVPFSNYKIPPTRLGLPYLMAIEIFEQDLTTLLRKSLPEIFAEIGDEKVAEREELAASILKNAVIGNERVLQSIIGDKRGTNKKVPVIKKMIKEFVEKQLVVFGRQPSLHKFSMRAFIPVMVDGKSIQVHPLVCTGFNADFDGDTGYVIAPLTLRSCQEAWKTLSVVNGIINPGTGNIIIEPSQDILLGLYYATSLHKNELLPDKEKFSPLCYHSLDALLTDLDLGMILPSQWVVLLHKQQRFLTTAGRIAFNSLLPGGFSSGTYKDKYGLGVTGGYKAVRYDGVVSGRVSDKKLYVSISTIFRELHDEYCETEAKREELIDIYQRISEFGFKWSERSGISFNLDDLQKSPMIEEFLDKAEKVSAEIDRQYAMGLMTAEDRRKAVMAIYSEVRSESYLKEYLASFGRTNNIFMMYDSKAKGSEDQIMQTCGMLGVLQKTKTETLEVPITGNYSQGLTSYEYFQTSYAARLGLLSTIMETQKPGELTRTLVYAFSGLHVTEHDCGAREPLRIHYERVSDFLFTKDKDDNLMRIYVEQITGACITDELVIKYDKVCGNTGLVTAELLKELAYSGLPWFDTSQGRIYFDVKMPNFVKKLLMYRTINDNSYPDLIMRKYTSAKTIDYIESEQPRFLDVMLIINCLCRDSICADSYGLRYAPVEPIPVGSFPGVEAAQSVGEPSAQLTMDLANKGGKAGESVGDGISLMMSAIKNGSIALPTYCWCAPSNGYIDTKNNRLSIMGEDGSRVEVSLGGSVNELLVRDGSYVMVGQKLTKGAIHPIKSFIFDTLVTPRGTVYDMKKSRLKSMIINPSAELVARIRYEVAAFYDFIYSESRIKIMGRHFEIAAFMQTSHGTVLSARESSLVEGQSYFVGELLQEAVDFSLNFRGASEAMMLNAGPVVATCYQDAYNLIADASWLGALPERSPLSALLTGSPIVAGGTVINKITKEVDEETLKYVKRQDLGEVVRSSYEPVVFSRFDDENTEIDSGFELMSTPTDAVGNLEELEALLAGLTSEAIPPLMPVTPTPAKVVKPAANVTERLTKFD